MVRSGTESPSNVEAVTVLSTCDVLESDPTMIRLCSCISIPLVMGIMSSLPAVINAGFGGWERNALMGQLLLPASVNTTWNSLNRRHSLDLHQSSLESAHQGGSCQKHSLKKVMMSGFLILQTGQPS